MQSPPRNSEKDRSALWILTLVATGLIYLTVVVRMLDRWWFQDDAGQFYTIRNVSDPLRFFLDLKFARSFGSGQGLVPMQMLDYWIDVHLPVPMPLGGYLHSLLTALAALVALFFVVRRTTGDERIAFAGALVWLLLPSTTATCLYLSTRHYVEGLVFASVVFCIAFPTRTIRHLDWATLVTASVAAMLSKEIYAGLVPAMLLAFGVVRRDRLMFASAIALGLAYAVYREVTVGGGMQYAMPLLGPTGYLKYLVTMPFTFAGSLLAYPVLFVALFASVRYFREGGAVAQREIAVFVFLLAVTLFVLYPVAYAVVNNYRQPGTWYRGPFLPNTIVLAWICLLVARLSPGRRLVSLAVVGASLLPGLFLGLRWWNANMVQERVEAKFLLDHPDRLVFTDDPCWWYLRDIQTWYGVPHSKVLLAERPKMSQDLMAIRQAGTLWSYQNGAMAPDSIHAADYFRGITPTFRGHSPAKPR